MFPHKAALKPGPLDNCFCDFITRDVLVQLDEIGLLSDFDAADLISLTYGLSPRQGDAPNDLLDTDLRDDSSQCREQVRRWRQEPICANCDLCTCIEKTPEWPLQLIIGLRYQFTEVEQGWGHLCGDT